MEKKKIIVSASIIILLALIVLMSLFTSWRTKEGLDRVEGTLSLVMDQFWDRVSSGITRKDWEIIRVDRYNDEVVFIHARLYADREVDVTLAYLPRKNILYLEDYSVILPGIDFNRIMYVELRQEKKRADGGGE